LRFGFANRQPHAPPVVGSFRPSAPRRRLGHCRCDFRVGQRIRRTIGPTLTPRAAAQIEPAPSAAAADEAAPLARRLDPGLTYPAEVLRVIDGDTFEARVRVWPGLDVDTKVRLRGIDAAELHARCGGEAAKAQAARAALQTILGEGGVTIARVGIDKYGGRVDAATATRNTADVATAMLSGGFARSYDGGKRGSWCG
jgi:endonuclease YncB( thermonuclease family)